MAAGERVCDAISWLARLAHSHRTLLAIPHLSCCCCRCAMSEPEGVPFLLLALGMLGDGVISCPPVLLPLATWLQAIPMLFLWETKRKDRWEVLAHHIATIVLIAYSYYLK